MNEKTRDNRKQKQSTKRFFSKEKKEEYQEHQENGRVAESMDKQQGFSLERTKAAHDYHGLVAGTVSGGENLIQEASQAR